MKKTITIPILLLVFSLLFFNSYGQKETKPKPETKEKQKQAKDSFGPTYRNNYKTAKKSDSFGPTYRMSYANNPDNTGKQTIEIKPYAGFSQPVGSYSGFSKTGAVVGLSADYFITPNFGFGIDVNSQFNGFKHPFDFSRIPETIQAAKQDTSGNIFYETEAVNLFESQNGSWTTTTLSFGPTYRMNYKKISSDLYAKVGVSILSTPEARIYHEYDTYETDLFRLNKQNSVSFGLTSGARFYYHINKMFSVYVNPQVVFTAAKIDYSYVDDLDPAFNTGSLNEDSLTGFYGAAVSELVSQEASFNPVHFNLNAGLSINIGTKPKPKQIKDSFGPTYRQNYKKKSSINNEEIEEDKEVGSFGPTYRQNYKKSINNEDNCQACTLSKTNNQKDYALDEKDRPDFNWENNPKSQDKPDKYILRLSNEKGEILYTEETKKTSAKHNQELESVYQNYASDKKKKIYWDVESQSEECGSQTSERNSFSLKSGSTGLDIDLNNVSCESPAFNDDGTVSYTAEILFTNSVNNDNSITIPQQTFTFTNTNGTEISNATETNCSGNIIAQLPFTLAPGTSQTVCVEFKRPFGENATVVNAEYVQTDMPNIEMNEIASEDLPSCVCNVCEDWKYSVVNTRVQGVGPNNNKLRLLSDLRIIDSELIQEVDAEIVSVQHLVNDEQCYSCTKNESEMALFTSGKISPRTYWESNGGGQTYERNVDNIGNILSWKAKSPGVDFNSYQRFHLYFTIPQRNSLECCSSLYTVCVRYTFTNINCETCSYVKCYDFDLKDIEELDPLNLSITQDELEPLNLRVRP